MTYKYRVTINGKSTTVTLLTDDPNEVGSGFVDIMGDNDAYFAVKDYFDTAYTAFGHVFDIERTTAIDLDYALRNMPKAKIQSIGSNTVTDYDPGLKDDEIT